MAIDVQQTLEDALGKPKSATTEAGTVVALGADDTIKLLDRAQKPKRPPFAVTRAVLSGAVGPRTGSDTAE